MSCLFDSLKELLEYEFQGFTDGTKLRDIVCDYILERPNDEINGYKLNDWIDLVTIGEFQNKITVKEYAEMMRKDHTWGGGPEMSIISKLFNVEIHVVHEKKVISKFRCCDKPSSIITLDWSGEHYEPIDRIYI